MNNEPNFLCINTTDDDCIPIKIDGNADRDALIDMVTRANQKDAIYAWLLEHTEDEQGIPPAADIVTIDLELWATAR